MTDPRPAPGGPGAHTQVVRSAGVFEPGRAEAVAAEVSGVLRSWQVKGGAARLWALSAAGHLKGTAEWRLEYDPQLALVSFEVWAPEGRVFGIDDWLG